jgi:transcriptional regulator with XRE-family HTH domain
MKTKRGTKKGSKIIGTNLYHFGRTLAVARRKKGLTQIELAQQLNTTSRTISYYERESKNPSLEMVKKIADVLGIRPESLLDLPRNDSGDAAKGDDFVDRNLSKKFEVAQKLPLDARAQLKKFIDTLAKANNIQE